MGNYNKSINNREPPEEQEVREEVADSENKTAQLPPESDTPEAETARYIVISNIFYH